MSDLELDTERAEADLEPVRQRLIRNEKRIADGTVDAKSLGSMVDEVAHLRRRICDLEDVELEVDGGPRAGAGRARRAAGPRRRAGARRSPTATAARDAAVQQLTNEANYQRTERDRLLPDVPADLARPLHADRRRARAAWGGRAPSTGAAPGCQLEVNANELRAYATAAARGGAALRGVRAHPRADRGVRAVTPAAPDARSRRRRRVLG